MVTVNDDTIGCSIVRCLEKYEDLANERGIWLEMHTDFEELNELSLRVNTTHVLSCFNPKYKSIGPANGFWISGVDSHDKIVHTQAVRFDDLSGTCLANYLESLKFFYDDPESAAHPGEICDPKAPALYSISGRTCYQGELWLDKAFRGQDLAVILPKLSMAISLARWSPDYLYGLVSETIVKKGIVAKYGQYNLQPDSIYLVRPQYGKVDTDWLEWITWREMVDQIERS